MMGLGKGRGGREGLFLFFSFLFWIDGLYGAFIGMANRYEE